MYAISYQLLTGAVLHRAASAQAALEDIELLKSGGAAVEKIVATLSGTEISVAELRLLAQDEQGPHRAVSSRKPAKRKRRRLFGTTTHRGFRR
jgi:hypothetical protein